LSGASGRRSNFAASRGTSLAGEEVEVTMQWLDAWDYWRVEPESLLDAGHMVVVLTRSTGKGRASGVELEPIESAHVVTIECGRIVRVQGFYDRG
jgi:ketosteroid isomerase-like protein